MNIDGYSGQSGYDFMMVTILVTDKHFKMMTKINRLRYLSMTSCDQHGCSRLGLYPWPERLIGLHVALFVYLFGQFFCNYV